jgi:hypothetical protein
METNKPTVMLDMPKVNKNVCHSIKITWHAKTQEKQPNEIKTNQSTP